MPSSKNDRHPTPIGQSRLISMLDVVRITTYSRPSIYRLIETRGFPKPIKLGDVKIAFHADEVEAWLASRPRALPSR